VLAGKALLLLHPWAQGFLHTRHLHAALSALMPADGFGLRMPAGKLVERLMGRGLSREAALMHLMWLAKYDLVSFGSRVDGHSVDRAGAG
jgi:hypothetical protein